MNSYSIKKKVSDSANIWPGFVDILATLLIVIIFILMIFTVSQFYLSDAVVGRDKALADLRIQISQLSKIISITESDLESEKIKNIEYYKQLQESKDITSQRDIEIINLSSQINNLRDELQIVAAALEKYEVESIGEIETAGLGERINKALARRVDQLKNLNIDLANLNKQLLALNEELDIRDIELLNRLKEIKQKNTKLSALNESLVEKDQTIFSLRGKISKLNDILVIKEKEEETKQKEITLLTQQIEESKIKIQESDTKTNTALVEVASMIDRLEKINSEVEILNAALEASERDKLTKEVEIEELGKKLNKALTNQVFKLQEYRSEFFGRLKEILGSTDGVEIRGDRFIFESSLLFDSGSAVLQEEGKNQLIKIAKTLKNITDGIPDDINWIIQVEGHTDNIPINTYLYPSNWELSTARASSVLKLLIEAGFKPNQLAAAGYGESYPISQGETQEDLRQNRRIELKLTSR